MGGNCIRNTQFARYTHVPDGQVRECIVFNIVHQECNTFAPLTHQCSGIVRCDMPKEKYSKFIKWNPGDLPTLPAGWSIQPQVFLVTINHASIQFAVQNPLCTTMQCNAGLPLPSGKQGLHGIKCYHQALAVLEVVSNIPHACTLCGSMKV